MAKRNPYLVKKAMSHFLVATILAARAIGERNKARAEGAHLGILGSEYVGEYVEWLMANIAGNSK